MIPGLRKQKKQPPSSQMKDEESSEVKQSVLEQYQMRQKLKMLKNVRCEQSSCISLYVPEREKLFDIVNYLVEEEASASSIKSSSNRKSVEGALCTIKERLKLLPQTQPLKNGLVIFCAEGYTSKRLLVEIYSPASPVKNFIYKCQATFYVSPLEEMLIVHPCYGFVVSDGSGYLIAKVQGNVEILAEKSETLPNKHNKGGQSSVRFSRLCEATRVRLAKNTADAIIRAFVDQSGMKTQLRGIVICGMSQIKDRVMKELTDICPSIAAKVIGQFDVGYGGRAGLRQAMLLSGEILQSEKHSLERKLISEFLSEFTCDSKKIVYGLIQTIKAILDGNVKKLLLFEDNELQRVSVSQIQGDTTSKKMNSYEETIKYLNPEDIDRLYNNGKGVFARTNLVEWIVDLVQSTSQQLETNSTNIPIELEFVSDQTELGHQFAKGFQGIAAFLRFPHEYATGVDNEDDTDDNSETTKEYSYDDEDDLFI